MLEKAKQGQEVWFVSIGDDEAEFGKITGLQHEGDFCKNYRKIDDPKLTDEVEITGSREITTINMEYVYSTRGEAIDAMVIAARARILREQKFINHLAAQCKFIKSKKRIKRPAGPAHKLRFQYSTEIC